MSTLKEISLLMKGETDMPAEAQELASKEHSDKVQQALRSQLREVLLKAETHRGSYGQQIKLLRGQVTTAEESLFHLNQAEDYLAATGNPWPLVKAVGEVAALTRILQLTGITLPLDDDPDWIIPTGWGE